MSNTQNTDEDLKSKEGPGGNSNTKDEQVKESATAKQEYETAALSNNTFKPDRDFEGGFGGQEDLEDRYATTSGEHWFDMNSK